MIFEHSFTVTCVLCMYMFHVHIHLYTCTLYDISISSASLAASGSFQFPVVSFDGFSSNVLERGIGQCNITSPNGNYLSARFDKKQSLNPSEKNNSSALFIVAYFPPLHKANFEKESRCAWPSFRKDNVEDCGWNPANSSHACSEAHNASHLRK